MKPTLLFVFATLRWLCYTTKRSSSHFYPSPSRYTIYLHFRPRWWLPFFWLWWLLGVLLYLFDGGIRAWWHDLTEQFDPDATSQYSQQGYGDLPTKWADKLKWWYQTYTR